MKKYDLIILAGGKGMVTLPGQGEKARTLAELKGRRLLDYILDAVKASRRVDTVTLVAHSTHREAFLQALPGWVRFCACDGSMAECAWEAIRAIQGRQGRETVTEVVTVCDDLPFLTGEALDDFIARAEERKADGVYAIVRKEACLRDYPALKRTYFHLKEGEFTGGNVSLVSTALFPDCIDKMKQVFALRKEPMKLAGWLGASFILKLMTGRLALEDVERKVSELFGYEGRAVITDYACIGTDLDRPGEWPVAEKYL